MATEYITSVDLEPYFVDKDTGYPLSGGYIQFWKDSDRIVPKLVYQKVTTGTDPVTGDPVYEFVALPDPVTLSSVGTIQDANGNNVALYYYPFDADGNVELYYVAVFNSLGVQQFTREGWPNTFGTDNGGAGGVGADNQLSNSQFVSVNFLTEDGIAYTSTGAGDVAIQIAPDWTLNVTFTAAGIINVNRTAIDGNDNLETNPPYVLVIQPLSNISALSLTQELAHNPGIWSAVDPGINGYLAAFMLLGPGSSATMYYAPSVGAPTQILTGNNVGADFQSFTNTVQLDPSSNTDDSDTGFVNIKIDLPTNGTTRITSLQVIGLSQSANGIGYIQEPVNRQIDHLFNYFNEWLSYKPIPSYLVGWDFALNPRQALGDTVASFATGAHTSNYVMDQTIVFQSTSNSFTTALSDSGGLLLTATADTQLAIIQYIDGTNIRNMTLGDICSMVEAYSDVTNGLTCTVSLWGTLDGSLPDLNSPNFHSIVQTLSANGKPATFNGTWIEIPRNFGAGTTNSVQNAQFKIEAANTQALDDPNNAYGFSGWNCEGLTSLQEDADFLAIVIGTATIPSGKFIHIQSATWQDGRIPTRPAPQSYAAVQQDVSRYYEKSFTQTQVPAQNVGVDTGEFSNSQILGAGVSTRLSQIAYQVTKRVAPTITLYNPAAANAQVRNETFNADCSLSSVTTNSPRAFAISCTTAGGSSVGETLGVHWVADARLGIVN